MYLQATKKLNDFLSDLVVSDADVSFASLYDEQFDKNFTDPLTGRIIIEHDGLLFQKDAPGSYALYDQGALWDPIEKRVTGDHYATSHYVLMCAALFRITGEAEYLARAEKSMPFCFRTLRGYPRVPWGMHFDFNNYALVLTLNLLQSYLDQDNLQNYYSLLHNARMNRHRTINWAAQRVLYCDGMQNAGMGCSWRHVVLSWLYRRRFAAGIAQDGSYEDHPGRSRPIQYHAFSLALDVFLHSFRPGISNGQRLARGVEYLARFIAPDGDFNYFGRGQRQIFAYSPALFVFESFANSNPFLNELSGRVWDFVRQYQRGDGSFPLVLNNYPDYKKNGWYDYHRFSVYNAFFGAWLALAELQRHTKVCTVASGLKLVADSFASPNIHVIDNGEYYICLSKGYSAYSSECALSPHKLFFREIGTIISCPGGPRPVEMGFGNINIFENEKVNFFSPIYIDSAGNCYNPGMIDVNFQLKDSTVSFALSYGALHVQRTFEFYQDKIEICDNISVDLESDVKEIRLVNLPLNVSGKRVELDCSRLVVYSENNSCDRLIIDILTDAELERCESYEWVEGQVDVFVAKAIVHAPEYFVSYKFYLESSV